MVTYDGVAFVVEFNCEHDLRRHSLEYTAIKTHMAQNMELFHNGSRSPADHDKYFRRSWIPEAHAFVTKWGKDRVPPDLRRGINSAEDGLGLAVTSWPNIPSVSN